jgi:hypothetical protein
MKIEPFVWEWDVGDRFAVLTRLKNVADIWQLAKGIPRAKGFPKDALFEMDPKFSKFVALADNIDNVDRALVVSKRLKEFIEARKPADVEYLRVSIIDHKGKAASDEYFVVHPVCVVDCIDQQRSVLRWNAIDKEKISAADRIVLKQDAVDGKHLLFRPKHLEHYVMVSPELAQAIEEEGFSGIQMTPLDEFQP